jgi:DNA-binding MarR family transcriptional regulator
VTTDNFDADALVGHMGKLATVMGRFLTVLAAAPAFKNSGISLSEWCALLALDQSDQIGNNQLARRLGVSRQRAHQLVAQFQNSGLIAMRPSQTDSRRNEITLTEAGHARLRTINAELGSFLKNVPAREAQKLARMRISVARLIKAMENTEAQPHRKKAA